MVTKGEEHRSAEGSVFEWEVFASLNGYNRLLPGSLEKCIHFRKKSTFVPTLTSDNCTRLAHIFLRIHWPFRRHVFVEKYIYV